MGYKDELTAIAKAYCKERGVTFMFVNDSDATFGYEITDDKGDHVVFVHKSFFDMAKELGMAEIADRLEV